MKRHFCCCSFILLIFFIACSTQKNSPSQVSQAEVEKAPETPKQDVQLSEDDYGHLNRAVYEIVTPRIEDKNVVYDETLPEHLLPYKVRKSPYQGIGTAFAIGPNLFVSAAHVFDLHETTLQGPLKMRDSSGKIYDIDKVIKYSQHRDFIEFTLKNPPRDLIPLVVQKTSRIGQYVFTVGNAFGDGIVTRGGNVTSYTPEPVNGDWNDIRYSAPASPGNSGGPLLNKKLEVVGIVVRRTENENLNFAIPIGEMDSVNKAEFFMQDVKIERFKKELGRDWKYETSLPSTADEISKKAHANFMSFYSQLWKDFQSIHKKEIFPSDPTLKDWAHDSFSYSLAGVIQKDNSDRWVTMGVEWSIHKLNPYQDLVIEKSTSGSIAFMLEHSKKEKLLDFYQNPKSVLDVFMKQIRWRRNYAGHWINILSYGKPQQNQTWSDYFGRKWHFYEWNTAYDDQSIQLNCLPIPAGDFCVFDYIPYKVREMNQLLTHDDLGRVMVDIYGKVRDWQEWVKLPAEWKQPMVPANVSIEQMGNGLKWMAGPFHGFVPSSQYDGDSEMSLSFNSDPLNIAQSRLRAVTFAEKNDDMQMGVGVNLRPTTKGHPSYKEVWDKMTLKRAPYNGEPQVEDKHSLIVQILRESGETAKSRKPSAAQPEEIFYSSCGILNSFGDQKIRKICNEFSHKAEWMQ